MSSPDIQPAHLAVVRGILRRHVPDREARIYGSRATGSARAASDLDLVILGEEPLSFEALAALRDDFSESDLPYRVDVTDWASLSPSFRALIEPTLLPL